MSNELHVLIVSDEGYLAGRLHEILRTGGFAVAVAATFHEAVSLVQERRFDLALIDARLPEAIGCQLISELTRWSPGTCCLPLDDAAALEAAGHSGAIACGAEPPVTARRQAEERLEAERRKLQEIMDNVTDGIVTADGEGTILQVNPAMARMCGYSRPEEMLGRTFRSFIVERDAAMATEVFAGVLARQESSVVGLALTAVTRDGHHFPVKVNVACSFGEDGGFSRLFAVVRDFTEATRAEEALKESEQRYHAIFDQARDGIAIAEAGTGLIVDCNGEFERQAGRFLSELHEMTIWDLRPPDELESARCKFREAVRTGFSEPAELPYLRPGGTVTPVEFAATRVTIDGRQYVQSITRDLTDRRQAEEALRRAAQEWRTTFDSISDLISIHDRDFRIVRLNMAAAKAIGMTPKEALGRHCYEVFHGTSEPPRDCPVREVMHTGKTARLSRYEPQLGIHADMSVSPVFDENGEITACVHIVRDVTAQKQLEEQVQRSQLLASLGVMTAGIAHEVNNPLAIILMYCDMLLESEMAPELKKDLRVVRAETRRAGKIMSDLLTYSRKSTPNMRRVDLHKIIQRVLRMRSYRQKLKSIGVVTDFRDKRPSVKGDASQLTQVFMNLIVNAEHAFEGSGDRRIVVTTEQTGGYARVTIADSGGGIPEDNLDRVFDPFFTTRGAGEGTGLGLSVCYGIITGNGGLIRAGNNDLGGATMVVELPLADGGASTRASRRRTPVGVGR